MAPWFMMDWKHLAKASQSIMHANIPNTLVKHYMVGVVIIMKQKYWNLDQATFKRASNHYTVRRLTAKSREVLKPQDWILEWSHRFEIWKTSR